MGKLQVVTIIGEDSDVGEIAPEVIIFDKNDENVIDFVKTIKAFIKTNDKIGNWNIDDDGKKATNKEDETHTIELHVVGTAGMAATLSEHAKGYVATTDYAGAKTRISGDPLSTALTVLSPEETMTLAETLLGLGDDFLHGKYASLNRGSQRMNAGNRIRGAINNEKNDLTIESVTEAIRLTVNARPPVETE